MLGIGSERARLLGCLPLLLTVPARAAGVGVSIQYDVTTQQELADRLASELATEGYVVELRAATEPVPCDPNAPMPTSGAVPRAWIRLSDTPGGETVAASICYLGALPLLQTAMPSAPRGEPRQLAVAAAEALNGLRSQLPPGARAAPEPARPDDRAELPHDDAPRPSPGRTEDADPAHSFALGATFMANAPDLPVAPGAALDASLAVTPWLGLHLNGMMPLGGAGAASSTVTATVRTTWLRAGPRFRVPAGDFELSLALLAGPAVTWATATARAPRRGTADVQPGAVVSLGAFAEYPRRSVLFTRLSASGSALLPGVRVELWSNEPRPRGAWPLEASVALGLRWGR